MVPREQQILLVPQLEYSDKALLILQTKSTRTLVIVSSTVVHCTCAYNVYTATTKVNGKKQSNGPDIFGNEYTFVQIYEVCQESPYNNKSHNLSYIGWIS